MGGKTHDHHITVYAIRIIAQLAHLRTMACFNLFTCGATHFQAVFLPPVIDPIIETVSISRNFTDCQSCI